MTKNYNNTIKGVFDLTKEANTVGNIIVATLMYPKIIKKGDDDEAVRISIEMFLALRHSIDFLPTEDKERYANRLAVNIVDALTKANIIAHENATLAIEIAAEEILVRRCMENL